MKCRICKRPIRRKDKRRQDICGRIACVRERARHYSRAARGPSRLIPVAQVRLDTQNPRRQNLLLACGCVKNVPASHLERQKSHCANHPRGTPT